MKCDRISPGSAPVDRSGWLRENKSQDVRTDAAPLNHIQQRRIDLQAHGTSKDIDLQDEAMPLAPILDHAAQAPKRPGSNFNSDPFLKIGVCRQLRVTLHRQRDVPQFFIHPRLVGNLDNLGKPTGPIRCISILGSTTKKNITRKQRQLDLRLPLTVVARTGHERKKMHHAARREIVRHHFFVTAAQRATGTRKQ